MSDRELLLAATDKIITIRRLLCAAAEALEPFGNQVMPDVPDDATLFTLPAGTEWICTAGDYRRAARVAAELRKAMEGS